MREKKGSYHILSRVKQGFWRHWLFLGGSILIVIVALLLKPDPEGLGTHEQVGFPPCGFQTYFGIPGPFCGYTTAFVLEAHGRFLEGFSVQPMGALLFWVFIGMVVAVIGGIVKRWNFFSWVEARLINRYGIGIILLGVGLAWGYKLFLT